METPQETMARPSPFLPGQASDANEGGAYCDAAVSAALRAVNPEASASASTPAKTMYGPNRADWRRPIAEEAQVYSTKHTERSLPASAPGTTLPKHFSQPLTCFYWHTFGFCTKSDDQCLYAHYKTGVVASAPVSVGSLKGTVAGRNAIREVNAQVQREQELRDCEARLVTREAELHRRFERLYELGNLADVMERFKSVVADGKCALAARRSTLEDSRAEISKTLATMVGIDETKLSDGVLSAIDRSLDTLSSLAVDLDTVEADIGQQK